MKRIVSLCIAVLLVLSCVPAIAQGNVSSEDDFVFKVHGEEVWITNYKGGGGAVVFPQTWNGMPVVKIGEEAFMGIENVTSVTFPDSIHTIGEGAFWDCKAIQKVQFGSGQIRIEDWAFAGCEGLKEIALPAGVLSVGSFAFAYCDNMESAQIYSTTEIAPDAFQFTSAQVRVLVYLPQEPTPTESAPEDMQRPESTVQPLPVEESAPAIDSFEGRYSVSGSSVCHPCTNDVTERCAMDSTLSTAWNTHQQSVGEWYSISLPAGEKGCLAGFRIVNGYIKKQDIYEWNARVRGMTVYCDGEYAGTYFIKDVMTMQTIWLDEPVSGSVFRFEVDAAYYGNRYDDMAITEIELLGADNSSFPRGDLTGWGRAVDRLIASIEKGKAYRRNDEGYEVMGLQLLLQEGFGLLSSPPTGVYDQATQRAVISLMDQMRISAVADQLQTMKDGVVDKAFLQNLKTYVSSQ